MKTKFCIILISAFLNAFLLKGLQTNVEDNSSLYIYGTVTTVDDEKFTGQIRWGKEEAFWFDHFNSSKKENENLAYLSDRERKQLDRKDSDSWASNWMGISWGNSYYEHSHSFACHFGDIKEIRPGRGDRVTLTMRNGEELRLDGGSNDVGAVIRVNDVEMGTIKIDWDRVESIVFSKTPEALESGFGEPLYGTVETTSASFTGYLQWDHDERLSLDELNGDTKNGALDIPFGNIKSIENSRRGSLVEMKSGRTYTLTGSNDVDEDNRGIIVNIIGMGRVDIPWEEFVKITFEPEPSSSNISYDAYQDNKTLSASVMDVDGKSYVGRMVFDLDETFSHEILNGVKNDIEYFIPFRNIAAIKPKNREKSLVTLKSGMKLMLSDKVDVCEDNDGLLIFRNEDDHDYLPWSEVEEINITDR